MARTTWALGFTGAVGAGCTTAVRELNFRKSYRMVRLSDVVRAKWAAQAQTSPTRAQLQQLGDDIRSKEGLGALVNHALRALDVAEGTAPIAIDGVRNFGEVRALEDLFGHRFLLVGVLAPYTTRWNRVAYDQYHTNGLTEKDFHDDDGRDQDEGHENGQQVGLCVDAADAIINNSGKVALDDYKNKVVNYADVLTGDVERAPTQHEIRMYTATSQSHSSRCLKRHVGAIVVGADGEVVGAGYNENPLSMAPCVDEQAYGGRCFRDIVRNRQFQSLVEQDTKCPVCSGTLTTVVGPPWRCPSCASSGITTNLEPYFFPERAMNWCTAIHAEDRALRIAGDRAVGGMIYTTTFPCFSCAERIISARIKQVVFTEPYPDAFSSERLSMAGVEVRQFEGVRSSAFERVFASNRPR